MITLSNLSFRAKLLGLSGVLLVLVGGSSAFGIARLKGVTDGYQAMIDGSMAASSQAREINKTFIARHKVLKDVYLFVEDAAKVDSASQEVAADDKIVSDLAARLRAMSLTAEEGKTLDDVMAGLKLYEDASSQAILLARSGGDPYSTQQAAAKLVLGKDRAVSDALARLTDLLGQRSQREQAAMKTAVAATLRLVAILMCAAVALAVGISLLLARAVSRSIAPVLSASRAIANGDLDQTIETGGRDEVGQLAGAFQAMVAYLRQTADTAEAIAAGDLSRNVEPKGPQDTLGHAFASMVATLRDVVGHVQTSADALAGAAQQLRSGTAQSGQAIDQVVQSVSQVASASQDNSRSAQATNESVRQLATVIDTIANGAADQSEHVQTVSSTASEMAAGIEQVADNAKSVAQASEQARHVAESGARAVEDTVAGMAAIRGVVSEAASKVEELGKLSEKIGAVVETIDDIAEQTNLLALNAAIEAARAGEHGMGFAVVADEVRKLAERSQGETKAIADLIKQVQDGTAEAVRAMESGSDKVEQGSAKADQAGQALADILKTVEATVGQVAGIAAAAEQMAGSSSSVVQAMNEISNVVQQNSAATEEMAAQAGEVLNAIQSIAAATEEQSAATDMVSSSTEEMSAQLKEMAEQAEELTSTAGELRTLVARFRLQVQDTPALDRPANVRSLRIAA
jgi:methyl-accepting chemotaxis protein